MITQRPSPIRPRSVTGLLAATVLFCLLGVSAQAATLELTGPNGALVSLNDRFLGSFPLDGALELPPGTYTIVCQLPGHARYEHTVRLYTTNDWQRVAVRLIPLSRRTAWSSNLLLAGLGQHYLDHSFRGYVYNALEIGGLLTALAAELQRNNLESDYFKIVDLYNASINGEEILELSLTAQKKYDDMQDMESLRDNGLIVAGAAIAVSIVDALLSFPEVAAGGGAVPVQTGELETPWQNEQPEQTVHAGLRLTF